MKYKSIIFLFLLMLPAPTIFGSSETGGDTIYVASWNVENLFDTEDNPLKNDDEFTPEGSKKWTYEKLEQKLDNLERVINYMNDGCGPDILCLQEVENIWMAKRLIYRLTYRDYVVAYRESPDERGIDVTVIYDRNIFSVVNVDTFSVNLPDGDKTRYIMLLELKHRKSGDVLYLLGNHWPSRSGGREKSEPNRLAAAARLRTVIDSLANLNANANIIALGDFNDEPDNQSIVNVLRASKEIEEPGDLLNLSYERFEKGEGTYNFRKDWNMIDQIIVSGALVDGRGLDYVKNSFEIVRPEYMIQKEGDYKGAPLRTFVGNRYFGGFSDHFPVAAKFYLKQSE
ncbi:endonuclease/exonuclease/phosphatase family [Melioribacter roseus P3M-2]|jgi:endonuclease/exonuclease/phosphatase family metal-dependent hydrolase|uniref:Endonuclease/exonuclease/phosphatase family n=1 Tax=Melioribacter roseus (strain DSM 23840 / JCM 17771 / VKM B-2668 / P3M-2) TaxID=1191523 RepID=I7A3K8_MELRP|nr:endonuclease/exonuclease/phosphatase family protein [Melioribacter roseus]AFN75803.1 endonuclease/exonuclease/phosphatase family [Melioribacter roseus P3M-2]